MTSHWFPIKSVSLKVWSPDLQDQHHLGACLKTCILRPHPVSPESEVLGSRPAVGVFKKSFQGVLKLQNHWSEFVPVHGTPAGKVWACQRPRPASPQGQCHTSHAAVIEASWRLHVPSQLPLRIQLSSFLAPSGASLTCKAPLALQSAAKMGQTTSWASKVHMAMWTLECILLPSKRRVGRRDPEMNFTHRVLTARQDPEAMVPHADLL